MHDLAAGPEGERATARGSGAAGVGYCFNWMLSTVPYTELLKERGPKWLHLYIFKERELVQRSIELAEKANQTAGDSGFSAIILTCDHPHNRVQDRMVPAFGQRWMDMDCSPEAMNRLPCSPMGNRKETTMVMMCNPSYRDSMYAKSPGTSHRSE